LRAATPHRLGLPVLPRISSAGMLSPIPRWDRWTMSFARRMSHPLRGPATAAFPGSRAGRLPHHCFRGLLSVHYPLRPARSRGHSLALSIEGSGDLVTSAAAPIASGWNDQLPGGDRTHGRPVPYHGARRVEEWRGGLGPAYLFPALSSAGASLAGPYPVSTPRSSNRTVGFPESGSDLGFPVQDFPTVMRFKR
jgi:hypothetical protein